MIEIGELSLALAFAVSIYATVASFWGGKTNNDVLARSGQNAYFALLGLLTVASAALLHAFVTRDFTVEYVYNYSSRDLAMFYTVSAFWAGQKGSLLLWAWMLSLFGTIAILQNRKKNRLFHKIFLQFNYTIRPQALSRPLVENFHSPC